MAAVWGGGGNSVYKIHFVNELRFYHLDYSELRSKSVNVLPAPFAFHIKS